MQKTSKVFAERKITALCFSPNNKYCAVGFKNSSSFAIYELPATEWYIIDKWKFLEEVKQQTQTICSLDWSCANKILACSFDRSMLVLNYPITPTSKELVYSSQSKLSIIRGVWSPNGKKFAIGSSCKKLFVARYDPFLKMWVTVWLRVKEDVAFKSTVNTVRFHCSGRVVAAGSTDFTLKVVTAFLDTKNPDPNAEQMPLVEDYDYKGPFEKVTSMGEVLLNISNVQGWINDIAFGLKSEDLLVALHSNQLFVKKLSEAENKNEPDSFILWKGLPFNSLLPLNADTILAAGFDNRVGVFKRKGANFEFVKYFQKSLLDGAKVQDNISLVGSRLNMFEKQPKGLDKKSVSNKTVEVTPHTNVPQIVPFDATTACSWDVTGKILFWREQ